MRTACQMSSKIPSCLLAVCVIAGHLRAAGPEFEVASVRQSPEITPELIQSGKLRRQGIAIDGGRVDISNTPLPMLFSYAFRMPMNQITSPDWAMAQRFDIQAKLPAGASEDQVPDMVQALLADRFKLTFHREHKEQAVFALVQGKGGAKVKPAAPEAESSAAPVDPNAPAPPPSTIMPLGGSQTRVTEDPKGGGATVSNPLLGTVRAMEGKNGMRLEAPNTTFEGLAGLLTELMRQPVLDMTGLKGRYQVILELTAPDMADERGRGGQEQNGGAAAASASAPAPDPRLNAVLGALDKLGLKMESRKLPVDTIVVDHLEKTPTDN